jgi:Tol biopolymer transport system component
MRSGTYLPRLALLASLAGACGSPVETATTPPPPPPLTGAAPFVVSNSVTTGAAGLDAARASSSLDPVAFVSVVPGTLPSGSAVSIRVHRTGAVVYGVLIDGGLDPVAVPAGAGDTLSLTESGPAGPGSPHDFGVPLRKPPTIIRTYPGPNKRDVPLNLRIQVVLSEPIDDASLTPQSFELRSGSNPIAGQLRFDNQEHTVVEFTPAANLAAGTAYELVLRPGIRDLEGTPLETSTSIPFTTAATGEPVTQLAFVRDGQIHLVHSDGTGLVQLTHTGDSVSNLDPAWSPDGQRLAFTSNRAGDWDIYVMNADGSDVVRRTSGGSNTQPAWAPDGRMIAFTSVQSGSAGVWVIDADGGQGSRVILDRPGYDATPAWSPDGRKITFTSDWRAYDFVYDLYVMNADGSNVQPLLEGPFFWVDGLTFYFQSAWSPDGQKIAVVVCGWAYDDCFPNSAIALANADGSGLKVIARAGGYARPTWSPDGRTIAFASSTCRDCQPSLRVVRADGSAEGLLVTNGHSPAWRP